MRARRAERGNTILIATVLILGMTVLSLGVTKFVTRHARDSADMKFAGYPAAQALYAAEMGVNALLYVNNTTIPLLATPSVPVATTLQRPISYSGGASIMQAYGYRIAYLGLASGNHRFEVTGEARPVGGTTGWPAVTRVVRVDIASGSVWSLSRYEQL